MKDPKIKCLLADLSDEDLKAYILESVCEGKTYRKQFRKDYKTLIRIIDLFNKDIEFNKTYKSLLDMRISEVEECVLNGTFLEDIPTVVDKLGNIDLAPGYLRLAEMQHKRAHWILERRNAAYMNKTQQDITSEGKQLGCVIIPSKAED
jgi:hypothetical protein